MTAPTMKGEGIFRDRRSPLNASTVRPVICRRKTEFSDSDVRPWWLKVNYVSQDPTLCANDSLEDNRSP